MLLYLIGYDNKLSDIWDVCRISDVVKQIILYSDVAREIIKIDIFIFRNPL